MSSTLNVFDVATQAPAVITFDVTSTVINSTIPTVYSSSWVPIHAYVSRISNVNFPFNASSSDFNVDFYGLNFRFVRDSEGWTIAYQYACPIFT